tara:strand:- start:1590 stop:1766 length:177 start_codon:yes stop_codon:yes gene_type:complete
MKVGDLVLVGPANDGTPSIIVSMEVKGRRFAGSVVIFCPDIQDEVVMGKQWLTVISSA